MKIFHSCNSCPTVLQMHWEEEAEDFINISVATKDAPEMTCTGRLLTHTACGHQQLFTDIYVEAGRVQQHS